MHLRRIKFAASVLVFSLACTVPPVLAKKKEVAASMSAQQRALHALNRLTFGPRPGDVQQVMAMGVEQWIELQLHPEKIDDSALNTRLGPFRTLRMSTREIAETFPDPQEIRQVMNGKRPMPSDPTLRLIYEVQAARLEERKERKEETAKLDSQPSGPGKNAGAAADPTIAKEGASEAADHIAMTGKSNEAGVPTSANDATAAVALSSKSSPEDEKRRMYEEASYPEVQMQQLANLAPEERYKKILSMPVNDLVAFIDSVREGKAQPFLEGLTPAQKETLIALKSPQAVVDRELLQGKLLRAVYGQRQLEEVMTDFWFNHFNVFVGKGLDRLMVTSYERDVIRPHALGKFEDLLAATAKSPAMLFYLDNWMSEGPNSPQALGVPQHPNGRPRAGQGKRPNGLNENYGRELLELHTLSVNGGYSQRDVTEVAKVFTGWTIDKPAQGGGFKFEPRMHEPGPKVVLGHRIKPKGEEEGLELLHRLATNPRTAHFISLKLAERFVSDDPPPALVDHMAKTFLKKKGDIRQVLETLFHSPEFWDETSYRTKVKTPLEFVASAIRATGAEIDDALPLAQQLNKMGMPLYGAQPPTGYSMKAETWVSSSALLNRMNFALALTSGKVRGVKIDVAQLTGDNSAPDLSAKLSALETSLVGGGVSQQTHDSIVAQIESGKNGNQQRQENPAGSFKPVQMAHAPEVSVIAGLLLGSPEFQRR